MKFFFVNVQRQVDCKGWGNKCDLNKGQLKHASILEYVSILNET